MKKYIALLLALLCLFGVCSAEEYKIAVIAPLTGDFAEYGEAYRSAVDLAVEEAAKDGLQLTYEIFDDKNDPRESATIAGRIASDDSVLAVIGPFASTCAMACAPIFQSAGIVEMCPTCTHPDLTKAGDFIFRGAVTSELEAPAFADVTVNTLNTKKVGIIYTQDDWGITTYTQYRAALEALGAEVVIAENYISGATWDFTPLITKIASQDIDLMFIAAMYNDASLILEQTWQLGYAGMFAIQGTGSLYTDEFLALAGENAEGMYITASFFAGTQTETVQNFVAAYSERFGHEPNLFAASVYDGAGLIISAIQGGAADRAGLRDALAAVENYEGVTGDAHFTEQRDVVKNEVPLRVENGAWVWAGN